MNLSFEAASYFVNLLVMCLILVPLYRYTRSERLRQILLTCAGIASLYYIAPRLIVIFSIYWLIAIVVQRLMLRTRDSGMATLIMWTLLVVLLTPMLAWKLEPLTVLRELGWVTHALLVAVLPPIGRVDSHINLMLPVGLSFATFRAIDLLLQTYLGAIDKPSAGRIFAFGFCPMLLAVGPIAKIQEVDFTATASPTDLKNGVFRIVVGLVKIFILASFFQDWTNIFYDYDRPAWQIFSALVVFAFYFYLNFAGYSDLAIGIGRLFGMKLPENFNWPLFRQSTQQFWANWHASLSRFAQQYVFSSAGGYRRKYQSIALMATMMTIAWWHDLTVSWTLFGLYHGTGLIVHRKWSQSRPAVIQAFVGTRIYAVVAWSLLFAFVVLGFPIIMVPATELLQFYAHLLP